MQKAYSVTLQRKKKKLQGRTRDSGSSCGIGVGIVRGLLSSLKHTCAALQNSRVLLKNRSAMAATVVPTPP